MNIPINFSKLCKSNEIQGEDKIETKQLYELLDQATNYINSFKWCKDVKESYMGIGVSKILGIFLFHILPDGPKVDEWIWVIVGDLPPAYITIENAPNAACALDGYIGAMEEWVEAVKAGKSVDELIPVNVSPTIKYAMMLEERLKVLDKKFLSFYKDDLKEKIS